MNEDDLPQKRPVVALLTALLITEAYAIAGVIPGLNDERPRHKGGRRRKKTWIEKQQARRGWQNGRRRK